MLIDIRGHHFDLLPQKAIYWQETKALLIADLHLGKVTHFRKHGIAIPQGAVKRNIQVLKELIHSNDVERMILLGDIFHNDQNMEWDLFTSWRNEFSHIDIIALLGNHDKLPYDVMRDASMHLGDIYQESGFTFRHHPSETAEDNFAFCGHIHPVFSLHSRVQSLRLPCFVFDPYQMILPSFGVFTGGFSVEARPQRGIFVVVENKVLKV